MVKMKTLLVAALAAMGIFVGAGTASAVTMTATYEGTLTGSSYDGSGFFGKGAGSSLNGLSAVIEFTYNTNKGALTSGSNPKALYNWNSSGGANPFMVGKVVIGGITQRFDNAINSFVLLTKSKTADTFAFSLRNGYNYMSGLTRDPSVLFRFDRPFTVVGGLSNTAYFQFLIDGKPTFGTLSAGRLTVTSDGTSPIPIPAALPLLASGLVGIGIIARRNRRQRTGDAASA